MEPMYIAYSGLLVASLSNANYENPNKYPVNSSSPSNIATAISNTLLCPNPSQYLKAGLQYLVPCNILEHWYIAMLQSTGPLDAKPINLFSANKPTIRVSVFRNIQRRSRVINRGNGTRIGKPKRSFQCTFIFCFRIRAWDYLISD